MITFRVPPSKHWLLTTNYEPKSPSRRADDQSDEKIVIVRGALGQTNKIEAKQHPKQGCTRKAAKPVKAREEAQSRSTRNG
jgi:hypothetical protein